MITEGIQIEKARAIKGWMSSGELMWIASIARESKRILEVGSYYGRSARCWADNTPGTVLCVDPWQWDCIKDDGSFDWAVPEDCLHSFQESLKDHLESGKLNYVVGKFTDCFFTEPFDLIFIDGDHRLDNVIKDIEWAKKFLKPGGVLAGHDYGCVHWPMVKMAVDALIPNAKVSNTIWWTRIP